MVCWEEERLSEAYVKLHLLAVERAITAREHIWERMDAGGLHRVKHVETA